MTHDLLTNYSQESAFYIQSGFSFSISYIHVLLLFQENYYQSPGSSSCLPCDCYEPGSESSQCDAISGQCPCLPEIWGKTCDRCPYRYDEIRFDEEDGVYGCKGMALESLTASIRI